jgi:hypothetical protein
VTDPPKSSHEPARANEPIVLVIDDDESMRRALTKLFRSVGLQVEAFGSAPECCKDSFRTLPAAWSSRSDARIERPGLSKRISQSGHSHSYHLYDGPWQFSDDRQGHEERRGRFPDQTVWLIKTCWTPKHYAGDRGHVGLDDDVEHL